jgi:hypothetical protein
MNKSTLSRYCFRHQQHNLLLIFFLAENDFRAQENNSLEAFWCAETCHEYMELVIVLESSKRIVFTLKSSSAMFVNYKETPCNKGTPGRYSVAIDYDV